MSSLGLVASNTSSLQGGPDEPTSSGTTTSRRTRTSRFGQGYGYLPLVLPVAALAWLAAGQASATRSSSASARRSELALVGVELAVQRLGQPVLAPRAGRVQRLEPGGGELDERAPAVLRVRAARDEPGVLEVADRLRHRLRAHAVGGGEVADARGPLAVEAAEHRELRRRAARARRAGGG